MGINMRPIMTNLKLLERLCAPRKMSSKEKAEQRVSFIYGQLGGHVSKDRIKRAIE